MKNKKYIIGCLALLIAACGDDNQTSSTNTDTTGSPIDNGSSNPSDVKKEKYLLHKKTNLTTGEVKTIDYDSRGNILSETIDEDGNGVLNYIKNYTYDFNDNVTLMTEDNTGDGDLNIIEKINYDKNGNIIYKSEDSDADGIIDIVQTATYNSDNKKLTINSDYESGSKSRITYTYNAKGQKLSDEDISIDADGEVESSFKEILTYNDQGFVSSRTKDYYFHIDNHVKNYFEMSYNGNVITVNSDLGIDGTIDAVTTKVYDDTKTNMLSYSVDSYTDEMPNETVINTYDDKNNRLSVVRDNDGDGNPEYTELNTYDDKGNILSEKRDSDGDGEYDDIKLNTYDDKGNILSKKRDSDGDGVYDYVVYGQYDANNNVVFEQWTQLTEWPEWSYYYTKTKVHTYDVNNNKISTVDTTDENGEIESERIVFEYVKILM